MGKFFITIFILCISFSVFATEYFVSESLGNDLNNGLSKETPWKTLKKVQQESKKFISGDIIRFKTGDVWLESLSLLKLKGTINEPIIFSSYGTDSKPIFTAVKEQNLTWTNIGGNIWRNTQTIREIRRLKIDNKEVLGTILYSELGSNIPDLVEFFYGNKGDGNKYLYIYSNSNPNNRKIEFSSYPDSRALHIDLSENLIFENIEVQGGYYETIFISGSKRIELNNMKVGVMSKKGISIEKNGVNRSENIIIDNCLFDTEFRLNYAGSDAYDGSSVRGSTDGILFFDCKGGEIKNSIFKDWGHSSISLTTKETNDDITAVKIYRNYSTVSILPYGSGLAFDGNTHHNEAYNNHFFRTKDSQINGNNNHVHHNIFQETKNSPIHDYPTGFGVTMQNYFKGCHDNIVENNAFVKCEAAGIRVTSNGSGGVAYNNIIRNNIIFECGLKYSNIGLILDNKGSVDSKNSNIYQNNLVFSSLRSNPIYYYNNYFNGIEFNQKNQDVYSNTITGNLIGNPLFIDVEKDWHLKSNSPGIDAGTQPKATKDFDGNPIPTNGTNPDIGIYEFTENSTGQIKANAGSDQSICMGESVTLTASGGSSYKWSTGATTKSISVNPTATTTYSVTVSEGSASDTDDVLVTVNSVTAGAGGNETITEGESIILTASGGDSYVWNNGDTTQNIVVSPTTTTTYTVTAKKGECEDTDTVTITVIEATSTTITANAGSDESICLGESVTLTASGGTSYKWNTGQVTKSITVNPTSTTIYRVTVSEGGNSDTDDVAVIVTSVVAGAGSNKTITEGESINLTAAGGDSYVWSTGETTQNIVVSPTATTTFIVTAKKGSCEDTDTVTITVNEATSTTITANAGSDKSICIGESVTLSASGGTSYKWNTGQTTKSITVNPTATTIYTVTAIEGGNSDTDQVKVTVNEVTADAGSTVTIKEGESTTLTASGGDSYLWNTGAKTKSITVNPNKTTIYSVTVYKNNCEDSDSVQVTVNQNIVTNPPPASANAGDNVSICLGESVTLNATGGDSYVWSSGDTNKTIDVSPTRTTTYTLKATRGGTTDTDTVVVTVENCNAAIEDLVFEEFLVYPNPTQGNLNIQLNSLEKEDLNLVVMSLNGSIVYQDEMNSNQNGITKKIDLSRFAKGIYFIRLFNKTKSLVKKVLLM